MRRAIGLAAVVLLVFATPGLAAPGVELVKDIRPGRKGSRVSRITDVGGTLYFRAGDGVHGTELWTSDGTEAGTVLVQDIWPGDDWS
jgi:ELWxxDGT repeat protein